MMSKHESHSTAGRSFAPVILVLAALLVCGSAMGQGDRSKKKEPGSPEGGPTTLQRADTPSPARNSTTRCISLDVESAGAQRRPGSEPRFRATEIIDIVFALHLTPRGLSSDVASFRFYTPNGHLYEQIDVPFAADAGPRAQRRLPGYPHPLPVAQAQEQRVDGSSQFAVPVSLPVAGTLIVSNSLYGKWTVEAFVGDDSRSCTGEAEFHIVQ